MFNKKLIMTVVNRGFAEGVVHESRLHGAVGATVLGGRGTAGVGEKFMGMEITPEKEIILIVADTKTAENIKNEINAFLKVNSAAAGICFVLPIDNMTNKENAEVPKGVTP